MSEFTVFTNGLHVEEAERWWIERFVTTDAGRSFALREHKLIEGAKIKSHVRQRNARYDVAFIPSSDRGYLTVSPREPEAAWAYGYIHPRENGSYTYVSADWPVKQDELALKLEHTT